MMARAHRLDIACRIAEALLESASSEALELFEVLEVPTAVFDAGSQTPRLANAAWRAWFGTRAAQGAIGIDEVARTGVTMHVAVLALDLGGRPDYCAATLRPARAALGATTRVIVAAADITDEVIARQLAVDAATLVWSGPLAGDPDYFNQRWSVYAGNPGWQHAIHGDDLANCNKALAWAVRERGSTDIEARVRRAAGDYRWHRVRFAIASSGSRWFGTAIDIHDARDARVERDELLARVAAAKTDADTASRLKDQFLAVVSHELRAPLTTIVLWEGVLRDDTADPALRAKALEAIRQSALSQSRVVGDLLDVSRAISGKLHIDLRPVEISSLVRQALEALAPDALAKQIAIEHRDTLVDGEVEGDAGRLRQVLDNLLSNAVKFTDPGGRIRVALVRRGRSIVIEVEDTGRGIAAELLPRLFDPFSQSEDALTRGAGGLGLGLAIAKQLVELHGGTVVASSAGPGRGATLTVTLPATPAPARRRVTPPTRIVRAPELDRTRVLVIDDDHRVRDALEVLLDRAGAIVVTADSAEAARARIAADAPDVLVCDIAMPGEDGYSFMRSLRASRSDIAAIALTAYATEVDVGRALAAGFDRHLAKPIDFERLVANIDELAIARRTARAP